MPGGGLDERRVGELVREAMRLIELEELQPQLVEYYEQFARAYLLAGDLERARGFVEKADETWRLYGGEEHENLVGMRELWDTLEEAEREAEEDAE